MTHTRMALALLLLATLTGTTFAFQGGGPDPAEDSDFFTADEAGDVITRRVFEGSGIDYWGSDPSPDGRYLAFPHWDTGDLAVLDLLTGVDRRLMLKPEDGWNSSSSYAEAVSFSPDQQQIAFSWYSNDTYWYEVRVVKADGTGSRVILAADHRPGYEWWPHVDGWMPDGSGVIVTLYSHPSYPGPSETLLVPLQGGEPRVLLQHEQGVEPSQVAVSPDGRFLAYDLIPNTGPMTGEPQGDIYLRPLAGGDAVPLVVSPSHEKLIGWDPDGNVVFYSDRELTEGVWSLPVRNGRAAGEPTLLKGGLWQMTPIGLAGHTLVYGISTESSRIHTVGFDRAAQRMVGAPQPLEPEMRTSGVPRWSPDGSRLYYRVMESVRAGQEIFAVMVRSSTGTASYRIDTRGIVDKPVAVAVLQDPDRLVLRGNDPDGSGGIYVTLDLETHESKLLTREGGRDKEFHPEGDVFYRPQWHAERGVRDLVEVTISTGERRVFFSLPEGTDDFARFEHPALSRDGSQVAMWVVGEGARREVARKGSPAVSFALTTVPVAGGQPRELFTLVRDASNRYARCWGLEQPAWLPGDEYLLIAVPKPLPESGERPAEPCRLHLVPVEGGDPIWIGDLPRHIDFTVNPDGTRFAFRTGEDRGEIWVLEQVPTAD